MSTSTTVVIVIISTLVIVEIIKEPILIAQIVFQIALTIAVMVNGLAILAKLDEIEQRKIEVNPRTVEDIRYLLEKIFVYLDIYTSYHL